LFNSNKISKKSVILGIVLSLAILLVLGHVRMTIDEPKELWSEVVEHIKPATVKIIIKDINPKTKKEFIVSYGSGFVIEENGLVATANHIINGIGSLRKPIVEILFSNGDKYTAEWTCGSKEHDVAIIKITASNLPILEFEDQPIIEGNQVLAMGSNNISSWGVTDGIISKLEAEYSSQLGHGWLQLTAPNNPGYSGGPLVNLKGKVVGINLGYYQKLNETYMAISGSVARELIKKLLEFKSNSR